MKFQKTASQINYIIKRLEVMNLKIIHRDLSSPTNLHFFDDSRISFYYSLCHVLMEIFFLKTGYVHDLFLLFYMKTNGN